uniref:EOG090X019S n=1 Tax=Megafenestra aurita TaxID=2291010 RepID=A0A4Y7NG99_9CRUS|nr:EOG090X019S [Megafenestra aurita]SVE92229.1 EOG090X019S [Megafenestra aurita]
MHGTIGVSRSTNFSFKKDFVKDSMVVLGPERTFKLRNPLVHSSSIGIGHQQSSGLLQAMDDGSASLRGASTSPFDTAKKVRSGDRAESTRSYSLSSYDEIVRDATKNGRRWPSNHCFCLLGVLFCIGMGLAFGIYYGQDDIYNDRLFFTRLVIGNRPEKLVEFVYRGSFRIADGDWFEPDLADVKGLAFSTKARDIEAKLDDIFKNSSLRDIYHQSEILTFEGNEGYDLSVFFNLYFNTKKSTNDAIEMEAILREELGLSFPLSVVIDPASIEVRVRASTNTGDDAESVERRADIESSSENPHGRQAASSENEQSNFISPDTTYLPSPTDSTATPTLKKGQSRPLLTSSTFRPSVTSPATLIPINTFYQPQQHHERSGCVPISLHFCRHLPYNFTSMPNLLGLRNAREIDRLNEAAKLLVESECSPYIQHVLCHILQPPCDPTVAVPNGFVPPPPLSLMPFVRIPNHQPPCRSVCMAALTSCKARLGLGQQHLRDLLRCELFPIDDGMDSCTIKPSLNHVMEADPSECVQFMTANGQANRVCDGLMDCHDFSDEVACNYCPEGQVHCGVGASCIDVEKRCDGVPHCPNGSDERGCLTVAPDMAAANFVHQYFHEGYIVFTEGNNTGKICVDSLNSSSLMSTARQQSFLEIFGESACRSMSYRIMERIEIRIDNERSSDYAHLTEPIRWRATFLRAPCRKRQVLYLSCSGLECGNRPVHIHPDRPGSDLTLLPSAHGDWPWLAALIRDGVHACDATLVADQWLLTASSCFDGQNRAHWVARFAAVRLTSDAPWEQERRIIGMVKSPMKGNQLVLIKMETSVIYSDFVRPVCLARDHDAWISSPKSRCLFLGWGKDRDNLHEVTAKVVNNPKCDNVTTLCADVLSTFDACRNDEFPGSPLLCQLNDGGSWSLVGVSSENRQCDHSFDNIQMDRVYLGVSSISDWIMQTVRR